MSRMLFLRDIQVDIQMRCRDCGHEGVLARPDLERRFGPNYPVLSIAPHYRCSRCNSKDVESGPAPNASASFTAAPAQAEDFGGAMGALQGLLDAVRGDPPAKDRGDPPLKDDVQNLMDDDLLDTLVEEPEDDPPPMEVARPEPEPDEFDELFAKLVPARSYDEEEEDADLADEPPAPPVPPPPADSPFDETLAALRALTSAPEEEEEDAGGRLYDETAEVLDEAPELEPVLDEEPEEDLDDIPDEEILSFAIRDPDARRAPEPDVGEEDSVPDEPEDREPDVPEPEEEELRDEEPEDDEPLDFASYRRPPPEPGSLDESLAALRALVEKAAAEEPEPPPRKARKPATPAPVEPADIDDEPAEEPPPPLKTAQEKSLEETLAQLRGMLDLDKDPGEDGEPVIKPRRR